MSEVVLDCVALPRLAEASRVRVLWTECLGRRVRVHGLVKAGQYGSDGYDTYGGGHSHGLNRNVSILPPTPLLVRA